MSARFYTLLTDIGAAKLASAAALGVPLKITKMAVGDGGGVLPTPSAQQTDLIAEKRRADLNMLYIDPQNSSQIIAEQVIPETEGGWWIREVGLFDETGALIAVGNCPESYKPQLAEGSGRTQTVRMVLITSSTDNITLKIDPAVVLATRKYVDDKVLELRVYVDDQMAKHIGAADPHTQYAPKDSPTLTGTPKVPTAAAGNNTTQIASTAFVKAAIAGLVGSSPAALDTLNELAAALGNDANFATTMTNALAGKQPLDNTLTNLSGKDVAGLLSYLGLGDVVHLTDFTNGSGWMRFPDGTIIQYGFCSGLTSGAVIDITLPIAYPSGIAQVIVSHDNVNQATRPTVYSAQPKPGSRSVIQASAMTLMASTVGGNVTRAADDAACYGRYLTIGR
ncbi:phage tail protein [Scandinavium tedordense]|uniref:phage tail protein n=1 Tax=Scandinavium tedordense TaxID=2926521 RepID=UPI004040AF1F